MRPAIWPWPGFNWIGDNAIRFPDGSVQKVVAHAIMGGLLAELTGSDFKTGAAAAGLNEVLVSSMGDLGRDNKELRLVLSQLTGLVAAAAVDGDLDKGVAIAKSATQYNHDLHETAAKQMAEQALDHCRDNPQLCDLGIDFSKLTVDDVVLAMRVEGAHGKGIENVKPEAIDFVDGFMFSRAPDLRNVLYTETESERSRLDVENKATLALSVISLGNAVRNFGNFLQGLVRATPTGVPVIKAADELAAKTAGSATSETAGSIKNVNPGFPEAGRTHNCVNCSIATDATLAGNPASALPIFSKNGVPLTVLEKQFGTKFGSVVSSEKIAQQMSASGAGARGIVFGSYGPGQPGHVFNVVNQNGVVRFLDGQTGKVANLAPYKTLQLLRTN